jgi:hypothetical protein
VFIIVHRDIVSKTMDNSNNKYGKQTVVNFMNTNYIASHPKNKVAQSKSRFFLKLYISKIINACKYIYNIANNFWDEYCTGILIILFGCLLFLCFMFLTTTIISYGWLYEGCERKINPMDCRNNISFWKIASDVFYEIGEMLSWILSITVFLGIAIFISGCAYYVTKYTMTKIYNYVVVKIYNHVVKIYNYVVVKYREELPNIEIV